MWILLQCNLGKDHIVCRRYQIREGTEVHIKRYLPASEIVIPRRGSNPVGADAILYLVFRLYMKRDAQIIHLYHHKKYRRWFWDTNDLYQTIIRYLPKRCSCGCNRIATKYCGVCKIPYSGPECQKKAWEIHKEYCAPTFMEKLIKLIRLTCIGYTLSSEVILSRGTCESLFGDKFRPHLIDNNRCIYCHKVFPPSMLLKEGWSEDEELGDFIFWKYYRCVQCQYKTKHKFCLLPHDDSQPCPLNNRVMLLPKVFPLLEELPNEIWMKIVEMVREDFIDCLM